MGNLLSAPLVKSFQTYQHKYKTIIGVVVIPTVIYQIWKRRARYHPNIPMSVESKYTPYFGDLFRFIRALGEDDGVRKFYENVTLPGMKQNNNNYIMALSFPQIPGLPRPPHTVQLYHPKLVEIIFTNLDAFQKTEAVHDPLEELFGDGIFGSDPPKWKWHRKVASRIFSMRNLKDHIFGCGVKNAQILIKKMREIKNGMDIHDLLGRFTLQSFVESAFGEHLEIIESAPNDHPFNGAFDSTLYLLLMRYGDPFWKLKRRYKIGKREGKDIPNAFKILNDFVYNVINSRRDKKLLTGMWFFLFNFVYLMHLYMFATLCVLGV